MCYIEQVQGFKDKCAIKTSSALDLIILNYCSTITEFMEQSSMQRQSIARQYALAEDVVACFRGIEYLPIETFTKIAHADI
jgi:hypothetical protein